MKELTNLELLMEYMEQNQYFIGNDLLAKYNELLQKEKKELTELRDEYLQPELDKYKNIKVERLFCECPNNFDIYQETKTYHTSCSKEVKIIRTSTNK